VLVVGSLVALLGGCTNNPSTPSGSPSTGGAVTNPSTLPTGGASATSVEPTGTITPPPGATVTLRDADTGRTVTVKVGDPVTLTLTGTDWGFTDPKPPSVLTPMSPPIVAQEKGSSSVSFRAAKPGTATVTANRQSGASFQITVVVQ
jgi:hypothetical protein